jgi:hypothetical protein
MVEVPLGQQKLPLQVPRRSVVCSLNMTVIRCVNSNFSCHLVSPLAPSPCHPSPFRGSNKDRVSLAYQCGLQSTHILHWSALIHVRSFLPHHLIDCGSFLADMRQLFLVWTLWLLSRWKRLFVCSDPSLLGRLTKGRLYGMP